MCGIAAAIYKTKTRADEINGMLDAIAHRGDVTPVFEAFGKSLLGSVRLKIVDSENGQQPFKNETASLAVVFNGEIYNYKSLRTDLISKGHVFFTDCDTEVLTHLYEEYGKDMLLQLDGMFAFIIVDRITNAWFVGRDRHGIKPLYYCQNEESIYFSSEMKSFADLKVTTYEELSPGSCLTPAGIESFYKYKTSPLFQGSFEDAKNLIRSRLDQAVKKRVATDLPIGVFLSGGLDSSIIYLLCLQYHPDVTAIIIGTPEAEDVRYAISLCKSLNTRYTHVVATDEQLLATIGDTITCIETFELNVVRGSTLSLKLASAAQQLGFKVILCGEGSDEIFGGYGDYLSAATQAEFDTLTLGFMNSLYRTQLLRIDRTGMAYNVEVREPFMDNELVELALCLPLHFKITTSDSKPLTKFILREAFKDLLPPAIYRRNKMTLMEGAGAGPVNKEAGMFYRNAASKMNERAFTQIKETYPDYQLNNKEDMYYFHFFIQKYALARFATRRTFNATLEIK